MSEFAARIGRVRMKGGADVTIIEGFALPDDESIGAQMMRQARENVEMGTLAAYMVCGIHADGTVTFSHRIEEACPMARTLLPAYVGELVRRYMLTQNDAEQVFQNMFEWVE